MRAQLRAPQNEASTLPAYPKDLIGLRVLGFRADLTVPKDLKSLYGIK